MCTRYATMSSIQKLKEQFGFVSEMEWEPLYNIAPTDVGGVLIEENHLRVFQKMFFGLIPHWAKDAKIALSCLNARSETIAEKPAFRDSFRKRRGLVLADGFYEWDRSTKIKIPHFIQRKDSRPFGMAAVWDEWKRPDGKAVRSFAILTREPNGLVASIHDRIPILIKDENIPAWLNRELVEDSQIQPLLDPYPESELMMKRVSSYVSNSRNKGPQCQDPWADS